MISSLIFSLALVAAPKPVHAYAWHYTNITADQQDLIKPMSWVWDLDESTVVDRLKNELSAVPSGDKTIFFFHGYESFLGHPDDSCLDSEGKKTGAVCPFFDAGIALVKPKFEALFKGLSNAGVEVNRIVFDFEGGLSNWHPIDAAKIMADPRYQSRIRPIFDRDMNLNFWQSPDYLEWNSFMGDLIGEAFMRFAIYPAKKYYPDLKSVNWGNMAFSQKYKVPEFNGHKIYLYPPHVNPFSLQNPILYGGLGQIAQYDWLKPEGAKSFSATPFNALVFDANTAREAKLSDPRALSPWIAYKQFSGLYKTGMYEEMIFHAALAGADEFLLWNPDSEKPKGDDVNTYRALTDLNSLLNYDDRRTLITDIADWNAPWLITKAFANGREVMRVTFRPEANVKFAQVKRTIVLKAAGYDDLVIENAFITRPKNEVNIKLGLWALGYK